jgi:hypothetical protein
VSFVLFVVTSNVIRLRRQLTQAACAGYIARQRCIGNSMPKLAADRKFNLFRAKSLWRRKHKVQ